MCCDYALKVSLPRVDEEVSAQVEELTGAEAGVNTFVLDMGGRDRMLKDSELIEAMDQIARVGGLAMVHAENGDIVAEGERKMMAAGITGPEGHAMAHPEEAEAEAVMRACVLANQVQTGDACIGFDRDVDINKIAGLVVWCGEGKGRENNTNECDGPAK